MPDKRNAPAGNWCVPEDQADGRSNCILPVPESALLDRYSEAQFDVTDWYLSGYNAGIERGRQLADDEAAALWRNAARVIHEMAKIAPRDEEADARRAEERAAWWAERRGERRPA